MCRSGLCRLIWPLLLATCVLKYLAAPDFAHLLSLGVIALFALAPFVRPRERA